MTIKQPPGLYPLFFTEMWERFGYMCLQTILVLYLSHALHFSDHAAYMLAAAFSAFQWLTPVPGGYIADRYLGFQRTIIIGALVLGLGYLITAMTGYHWFLIGLAVLIVGNGFFKPNVSSIVGTLYKENDPRREGGFTIFYMGINLGTLIPPLFLGKLVAAYGWNAGFLVAAVGMLLSFITFSFARKNFTHKAHTPYSKVFSGVSKKLKANVILIMGSVLVVAAFYGSLFIPQSSNIILLVLSITIIAFLLNLTLKLAKKERNHMLVAITLTVISIGF
jgi:POT family proton-dependent oligopeptide transporter